MAKISEEQVRLKNEITKLGERVAAENTTTKFPEWCLLKIGLEFVKGIPFDREYWLERIEPSTNSSQSD